MAGCEDFFSDRLEGKGEMLCYAKFQCFGGWAWSVRRPRCRDGAGASASVPMNPQFQIFWIGLRSPESEFCAQACVPTPILISQERSSRGILRRTRLVCSVSAG